jgi:hypothetical protein
MKFAKVVFWIAGIWGILLLTPLYFMFDLIGRQDPPPITHPQFFYAFVSVAMVWQFAFFVIATDPARFRPMILMSVLEKLSSVLTRRALPARTYHSRPLRHRLSGCGAGDFVRFGLHQVGIPEKGLFDRRALAAEG